MLLAIYIYRKALDHASRKTQWFLTGMVEGQERDENVFIGDTGALFTRFFAAKFVYDALLFAMRYSIEHRYHAALWKACCPAAVV